MAAHVQGVAGKGITRSRTGPRFKREAKRLRRVGRRPIIVNWIFNGPVVAVEIEIDAGQQSALAIFLVPEAGAAKAPRRQRGAPDALALAHLHRHLQGGVVNGVAVLGTW